MINANRGSVSATRYHDFSCGHRVHGHESKCAALHGHNYRVYFHCEADALDSVGRVLDFSVMKSTLCEWLEQEWDHRFLAWFEDPIMRDIDRLLKKHPELAAADSPNGLVKSSIVWTPFNPTAENMARYLVDKVGPLLLSGTGVRLVAATVEETRKCSATATAHPVPF